MSTAQLPGRRRHRRLSSCLQQELLTIRLAVLKVEGDRHPKLSERAASAVAERAASSSIPKLNMNMPISYCCKGWTVNEHIAATAYTPEPLAGNAAHRAGQLIRIAIFVWENQLRLPRHPAWVINSVAEPPPGIPEEHEQRNKGQNVQEKTQAQHYSVHWRACRTSHFVANAHT